MRYEEPMKPCPKCNKTLYMECLECKGTGFSFDGGQCHECSGDGEVDCTYCEDSIIKGFVPKADNIFEEDE